VLPVQASPTDSFFYVMVVVESGGRFLLVEETDHSWFLPAGQVAPPEELAAAAVREAKEEAGVVVEPKSLLRVEYRWYPSDRGIAAWWRYTVRAQVEGLPEPKQTPDTFSLRAGWFTLEEARALKMRSFEVIDLLTSVANGTSELALPVPV
jgi:8-oxo-dGDP phosphatase